MNCKSVSAGISRKRCTIAHTLALLTCVTALSILNNRPAYPNSGIALSLLKAPAQPLQKEGASELTCAPYPSHLILVTKKVVRRKFPKNQGEMPNRLFMNFNSAV